MFLFILIISIANPIQSMNLEINGKINLGRNWHQHYRAQKDYGSDDSKQSPEDTSHVNNREFRSNITDSIVRDIKFIAGTKLVELLKHLNIANIVSNVKVQADNPIEQRRKEGDSRKKHEVPTKKHRSKNREDSTERHSSKKHKRQGKERKSKHDADIVDDILNDKSKSHEKSIDEKKSKSKHRAKIIHEDPVETPLKVVNESLEKKTKGEINAKVEAMANTTTEQHKLTDVGYKTQKFDNLLKPLRVKDDPQLVEHIKHIHAQSLKVINDLKTKTDNYNLKKDIDLVLRSYDEKFKEFVKENKYHKIKSRLGKKKVILNAADMSNNILNRLVTYVRSRVEASGLRSGVPNVFHNALQKKAELENQRICKKFAICRSGRTYRHFLIDMITIVLNSNDQKVQQYHNAMTEVLKTREFHRIMNHKTEKRFRRGIKDMESYDLMTIRAGHFIVRNILERIHEPIKVTNKNSKSVNKTVAFIDLVDIFEDKIPPNEKNKLEWDDMLNSLRQWSRDERKDIFEIFQTVVDHVKKEIDMFDDETAKKVEHNLNTMMN